MINLDRYVAWKEQRSALASAEETGNWSEWEDSDDEGLTILSDIARQLWPE